MDLSTDQLCIFDKYKQGENIFITGPGGCGKSFLLKYIVEDAIKENKRISTCALTGCAAYLLDCGATTLHRWAGIGLAKEKNETIIHRIYFNYKKSLNWKCTDILVVDEVSMMSKHLFELLDTIGKTVRKNNKPFGGIQLIFSGDFYQLPPIGSYKNPSTMLFCFESSQWMDTFDTQIELNQIFRQSNKQFIEILHEIRCGIVSKKSCNAIRKRMRLSSSDKIRPVRISPIKQTVQTINNREMSKLINTETIVYDAKPVYAPPQDVVCGKKAPPSKSRQLQEEKYLLKNCLCEEILQLKKGSQVMCIANLDVEHGLSNGSTGIITSFEQGLPMVKFHNGRKTIISYHIWQSDNIPGFGLKQIPLILAWAITIHKSQGATLESVEMDLGSNIFACGQTYVALSRVRDIKNLYVSSFDPNKIKINYKVREYYSMFEEEEEDVQSISSMTGATGGTSGSVVGISLDIPSGIPPGIPSDVGGPAAA